MPALLMSLVFVAFGVAAAVVAVAVAVSAAASVVVALAFSCRCCFLLERLQRKSTKSFVFVKLAEEASYHLFLCFSRTASSALG